MVVGQQRGRPAHASRASGAAVAPHPCLPPPGCCLPPRTLSVVPCPQQDQLPADAEARAKLPLVKAQKWALHISYRMFTRYTNAGRCNAGNDQAFAHRFSVRNRAVMNGCWTPPRSAPSGTAASQPACTVRGCWHAGECGRQWALCEAPLSNLSSRCFTPGLASTAG